MKTITATRKSDGAAVEVQIESEPCVFTYNGVAYEAGGAFVSPDYAVVYVKELPDERGVNRGRLGLTYWRPVAFTDWRGEVIGRGYRTGEWGSYVPGRYWPVNMESYTAVINGVHYVGRMCADNGSLLRLRRAKRQPANQIA